MAHVVLTNGVVTAMSFTDQPGIPNFVQIPDDDPRLLAFTNPVDTAQQAALKQLQINDGLMFRVLELLIDILLAKGTLVPGDFPPVVRAMYLARIPLRAAAHVP